MLHYIASKQLVAISIFITYSISRSSIEVSYS